jgi:hypothetical protein
MAPRKRRPGSNLLAFASVVVATEAVVNLLIDLSFLDPRIRN